MGRTSTFKNTDIFAAVGAHLSHSGSIKLQDIVDRTGVSIGSLYHHYGSREVLLARTWLDAVTTFQSRFIEALASDHVNAGQSAAMVTPQFCREEKERALVLVACRREELISNSIPKALKDDIKHVNVAAGESLKQFAKKHGYCLEACKLGLIAFPLGAVRLYLPHHDVPKHVDGFVANAFTSAINMKAN